MALPDFNQISKLQTQQRRYSQLFGLNKPITNGKTLPLGFNVGLGKLAQTSLGGSVSNTDLIKGSNGFGNRSLTNGDTTLF